MLKKAKEIIFKSKIKLNLYIHTCKEKKYVLFSIIIPDAKYFLQVCSSGGTGKLGSLF